MGVREDAIIFVIKIVKAYFCSLSIFLVPFYCQSRIVFDF